MHRRSGRVYPTELLCSSDLVATQRPCDYEVGIDDFFADSVVVWKLDDFELRKISPQPLREPERCDPRLEAMIEGNKKFHEVSLESPVSSFELLRSRKADSSRANRRE